MQITCQLIDDRIAKVRVAMSLLGFEALVIYAAPAAVGHRSTTSGNVRYFANWTNASAPSTLILPLSADPVLLVTSASHRRQAEESGCVQDVRESRLDGDLSTPSSDILRILSERDVPAGRIGLVGRAEMTADFYLGILSHPGPWTFDSADDLVARQRMIKDNAEIEAHRTAAKIADAMLFTAMTRSRAAHVWAADLMAAMESTGRSLGADLSACWIATGTAPSYPAEQLSDLQCHVEAGERVQAGTYVTYSGYWGHGLRMGVKGTPAPDVQLYFDHVLRVQEAGLGELRPGVPLRRVTEAMKRQIAEMDAPLIDVEQFNTLAHGLGLQDSEPLVSLALSQGGGNGKAGGVPSDAGESWAANELVALPGMVIALHPLFSVKDLGFFVIGDVVLVTEEGPELLTQFPRHLYSI